MHRYEVRTPEQALAYLTDCTLATVETMAMMKSRKVNEYIRQKSIAQISIDWMDSMHVDYSGTRADEVKEAGSVDRWAAKYEPTQSKP